MRAWARMTVLVLATAVRGATAEPTPSPSGRALLPGQPRAVCDGGCYGYSPATRLWICATEQVGSGMVMDGAHRCSLDFLRDSLLLGRMLVYKGTDWRTEGPPGSALPLPSAAAVVPPDLRPLQTVDLLPDKDVTLPQSGHTLRLRTRQSDASNGRRRRVLPAQVLLLCKPVPLAVEHPLPGRGSDGGSATRVEAPPTEIVVYEGYEDCGLTEQYQLQLSPHTTQIALIDRRGYGCVDYHFDEKHAHIVDVQQLCRTGEVAPK